MQVTVESCHSVSINTLQKSIKKLISKDYPGATVDEVYNHTLSHLNNFSIEGQIFEYEAIPNHLGGHRWFFLCPECKARSSKLFLPPESAEGRKRIYLCKGCHKLKNQSAIQGQNNMYRKVTKPLKRLKEIEDKIARGHLKSEKVQELLDEYEKIEQRLKDSPEFRLYTFKKKHKML